MTFKKLLFFFFILIYNTSLSQWKFIDSISIPPENYKTNFKQINDIVIKNYSHLKTKNIDLRSLFLEIEKKISISTTKTDYFEYLQYYFSKLKNSHTHMLLNDYGINCSARLVENRIFIDRVDSHIFTENGIKKGDEIINIDNIPVFEWLKQQKNSVNSSTDEGILNAAVLFKIFSDNFKISRVYDVKTSHGMKTVQTDLVQSANYSHLLFTNEKKATGKILNSKTAYIEIKSMSGKVVSDFINALDTLKTYPNLIIDLRRNSGGSSSLSEKIASFLIPHAQKGCVSRKKIKPDQMAYKGSVYVLIGVQTSSAAESLALDLLESDNAILVGSPTNGDTGNSPKIFHTDFGVYFSIPTRKPAQVSFKGFPMEGIGIPPHHFIKQNIEDYKNETDTILEYTINLIDQ